MRCAFSSRSGPSVLRALATLLLTIAATLAAAQGARAATAEVTVGDDPIEEQSTLITIAGQSDADRSLYVAVLPASTACPATAASVTPPARTLTTPDGRAVGTGMYSAAFEDLPPDSGAFRVCAYLALTPSATPDALGTATFTVRPPNGSVNVAVSPTAFAAGESVVASIAAVTVASGRALRYLWTTDVACPAGPDTSAASLALAAGMLTAASSTSTAGEGDADLRICVFITEGDEVEAAAAASALRLPPTPTPAPTLTPAPTPGPSPTPSPTPVPAATGSPTPVPVAAHTPSPTTAPVAQTPPAPSGPVPLTAAATPSPAPAALRTVTPDGSEQYDRLRLRWASAAQNEEIWIWDEDPASGAIPVIIDDFDGDNFDTEELDNGDQLTQVLPFLGFRTFWWQVRGEVRGAPAQSVISTVRIVPSPLDPAKAKASVRYSLTRSSRRPGSVRLRISASPRARVQIKIRYRGRTFASRRYTAGVGTLRGFDFTLSCSRTGTFSFTVQIRDPYGKRVTRRGHWSLSASRCASLRAAERRKAAAKNKPKSTGGGSAPSNSGGSNCDPNYSGACLRPDVSDYDCAGGSGNGPYYVQGPIRVVGNDHYALDADGDGVACES